MNNLIMLVGVPGCGKTTFAQKLMSQLNADGYSCVILSTDAYIEAKAAFLGKTYDECFADHIDDAVNALEFVLQWALKNNTDYIIWDQTNLTKKSRKSKLSKIPSNYTKIALVVDADDEVLENRRLDVAATGKNIPARVLSRMKVSYNPPTAAEGFDMVLEMVPV